MNPSGKSAIPVLSSRFPEAKTDFLYLLNRKYPEKATLKLIGDRYRLSKTERSVLKRGVVITEKATERKSKIITDRPNGDNPLLIDTYNVLITIGSYLDGQFLYLADDGLLRDAAESHGRLRRKDAQSKPLKLLLDYLAEQKTTPVKFYIDEPVSFSGLLAETVREKIAAYGIQGEVTVCRSADGAILNAENGVPATSDSVIIDKSGAVFDLARAVLEARYQPIFPSL